VNSGEFAALARVEREHWFYRGKRDIIRRWIDRLAPLTHDDLLIDVGAGTGQLLREFGDSVRTVGIEFDSAGLAFASGPRIRLVRGSLMALPLASDAAAVVTALDVLEHVDDDERALSELLRVTRHGGLVLIHVPAFPLLWSDWDEALGHKRRYSRHGLLALVGKFDVTVRRCVFVNNAVFLPVLCYRWLRTAALPGTRGRRLEDGVPPRPINGLLRRLYVAPACWKRLSLPFGVSLLCILQKKET
jgi:SAM-dependent methyltransferase